MTGYSPVTQQAHEIGVTFAEAGGRLGHRLSAIVSAQSLKGHLQTRRTVRLFAAAYEAEARAALAEVAQRHPSSRHSPVLRTKRAEAIERGMMELEGIAATALGRISLADAEAREVLRARRAALSRPKAKGARAKWHPPAWARKAGLASVKGLVRWVGGLITIVVGGYLLKTFGLQ